MIKISGTNVSEIGFEDQASSSSPSPSSVISISSTSNSTAALTKIDTAIDKIGLIRSEIAAYENNVNHKLELLTECKLIKKQGYQKYKMLILHLKHQS